MFTESTTEGAGWRTMGRPFGAPRSRFRRTDLLVEGACRATDHGPTAPATDPWSVRGRPRSPADGRSPPHQWGRAALRGRRESRVSRVSMDLTAGPGLPPGMASSGRPALVDSSAFSAATFTPSTGPWRRRGTLAGDVPHGRSGLDGRGKQMVVVVRVRWACGGVPLPAQTTTAGRSRFGFSRSGRRLTLASRSPCFLLLVETGIRVGERVHPLPHRASRMGHS